MQINCINNIDSTFKGNPLHSKYLSKSLNNVCKQPRKVNGFDKYLFRGYIFALNLKSGFKQEDINKLFKLDGDEFIFETYEFMIKHLGIPYRLRPSIQITELNDNLTMAYDYTKNKIEVDSSYSKNSKSYLFGSLRHEIQHFLQNLDIFRHETLGIKAAKTYAEMRINSEIETVQEMINKYSSKQLKQIANKENEEIFELYAALKYMLETNNIEKYNESISQIKNHIQTLYEKELLKFRKLAIAERGMLKKDSKEANRAEKFFKEFSNNFYFKEDGSIHSGRYLFSVTETEALIAGDMAQAEAEGNKKICIIKSTRQEAIRIGENVKKIENNEIKNDISQKEIQETIELMETQKEFINQYKTTEEFFKELTKYLYD